MNLRYVILMRDKMSFVFLEPDEDLEDLTEVRKVMKKYKEYYKPMI